MSFGFNKLGLVIAAGGSSSRFGHGNKLCLLLHGLPVFCHCLRNFFTAGRPGGCVIAAPQGEIPVFQALLQQYLPELVPWITLVPGGCNRTESVLAGLRSLPAECDFVAVQDAARPYSTGALLKRCLESAQSNGSGVAAHRATDTIKVATANGLVEKTLERATLWAAETPQVFRRELLENAYSTCCNSSKVFTDDAQLVEESGNPVYLVENTSPNPKITYQKDYNELQNAPLGVCDCSKQGD